MVTDYEALAEETLSDEQTQWLAPYFLRIDQLATKWRGDGMAQEVVCDYFWLAFTSELSLRRKDARWTATEFLIAREWMRSAMHRTFLNVGQYVDEDPLHPFQIAAIEAHSLSKHVKLFASARCPTRL
jgi:hypothetical protein